MVKKVDKEKECFFCSMIEQPELKQRDIDNYCVDSVYDLELIE